MAVLGEVIAQRRAQAGLSLQDVAEAIGMTKSYLHEIEKGKVYNIGILTAIRLSVALGIPVNLMAAAALESNAAAEKENK